MRYPPTRSSVTLGFMQWVLVSSCLVGDPVRYDGTAATCRHPVQEKRVVPFCPEIVGGLGTPRCPVELIGGDGGAVLGGLARAMGRMGEDVTSAFVLGGMSAAELCGRRGIQVAVLKEGSPSCGSARIHDGSFSGSLIPGQGVTAAALRERGVAVFSEDQWELAQACLADLDGSAVMPAPTVHPIQHPED
jgi:uncharacterized protein YbbK (DUF523 family)